MDFITFPVISIKILVVDNTNIRMAIAIIGVIVIIRMQWVAEGILLRCSGSVRQCVRHSSTL